MGQSSWFLGQIPLDSRDNEEAGAATVRVNRLEFPVGVACDRFAMFHEAHRSVSRDGHLEVEKAFYSAPPEYIGRRVCVPWDTRLVLVFNEQWK